MSHDDAMVRIRERLARGLPPFDPPPQFYPPLQRSALMTRALDEAKRRRAQRHPGLTDADLLWVEGGEPVKPVELARRTRKVSAPSNVGPDTMVRLEAAAELAFPDGSTSVAAFRREAAAGRLTIYAIAGKHFTTLNDVQEMKKACRVHARAPDYGSDQPAKTGARSTSSSMEARRQAQAAARATLREPSVVSKTTSSPSTIRGQGAEVIPMSSK
jgi:hypothetical protein